MLRLMPAYMRAFVSLPWLMFSSTLQSDLDTIRFGGGRRRRSLSQSLTPAVYEHDPLDEPLVDATPKSPEPKKPPKSPKKQGGDKKKQTLPTPTDVPTPTPTDVPVPEPWDVPAPDPKDPRPKSVP